MIIKKQSLKIEKMSYEEVKIEIEKLGEFAYLCANRFNNRFYKDVNGNVHQINFTDSELIKCYMEKIQTTAIRIGEISKSDLSDKEALTMYYHDEIDSYKNELNLIFESYL